MNVRSAFTFSYCTDLTSAVMRTNNQSKGAVKKSATKPVDSLDMEAHGL